MSKNVFEKGKKKEILFGGKVKKYLSSIYEANDTINSLITFERICGFSY
ncbi:MAG: hypothetical protein IJX34_03250 [Clostridia bacterium]|nr:hypothetical protein [Clostridia bacterium]